jgi:hypothetical protein
MTDAEALTILEDAHRRCGTEDMRTAEVYAALQQLEALTKTPETWPFDQFRIALRPIEEPFTLNATRGQVVNAALNGIRRVCQIETPRR